ncbi:hypothetical protein E0L36_20385 [Streptomyces sp. AJS327]|uniref:hypothetical protein n=1 Tax=Streptomyces sp. AJS327 TaxID=2545265 RepID=UPI0015DDC333|nr:hypothetical protein [Streptomyces sp. AJS327]MBA0053143.1 hypothetical protein [Streptomyces sp. AJS327]
MGIESDQLVFDYLSRVGDLAHGTSMTAAERARLVTGLRGEIDRMRAAEGGAESRTATRRILDRLGRPEDLVAARAGSAPPSPPEPRPHTPSSPSGPSARPGRDRGGAGRSGSRSGDRPADAAPSPGAAFTASLSRLSASLRTSATSAWTTSGRDASRPGGASADQGSGGRGSGGRDRAAGREPGREREPRPDRPDEPDEKTGPRAPSGPAVPDGGADPGSGADRARREGGPSFWKEEPDDAERGGQPARPSVPPQRAGGFPTGPGAAPPHLAGMDELGPAESDPNWWRVDTGPFSDGVASSRPDETVPGFVGGIELPEVREHPPERERAGEGGGSGGSRGAERGGAGRPGAGREADPPVEAAPRPEEETKDGAAGRRGRMARLVRGSRGGGPHAGGIVELAAVGLLFVGAIQPSLMALAVGWLAAWWSPRLSRNEAKWASAGMPGVVAGGAAVWLWGRMNGRWGEPIEEGGDALRDVLSDAFPVLLRVAAVASALFLLWRARRPRG